ncbi:MFS transporter [Actinoplanes sp. TBRC 11911]|uniref:MFS transporter n=1 Tax=Actinoplanes sp. TBRC 11911 TaxID=2729386 RepID=UPI00145D2CE4|nr:MFS transporter [Actinoplanes sp. TBRC 11911]NMO57465.1 MFS transporter [Actinoplanes sp. TBRC 11911]
MNALAPLRYIPFRCLIAGRTVNALGNAFAPIALAFAVLDLTGSATDLGLVVGTRMLVNVLFLLFGGVLADRLPKHLLMVGSSLAAAATQGVVATLVLTHTATIPLLIGLAALNGMVGALAMPASAAILPQTVPADVRQQANALNRLSLNGAALLGAPLAGVVVAAAGPGVGIAVDGVAFAISALCFAPLRAVALPAAEATSRSNVLLDLRTGWSEFRSRTWLWVVVAGFCVLNAAWTGAMVVLGPLVADATIGRRGWGFVLAAETAGMIVGALIALRLRIRRLLFFGVCCCVPFGLPVLFLGIYPHLWVLVLAALVAGLTIEQFGVAWETTMQEHVPADKLARVYSYDMVGSFIAIPVGEMLVGPISGAAGVETTLIGAFLLTTLASLAMLSSRAVRTLRHELPEPGPQLVAKPVGESTA